MQNYNSKFKNSYIKKFSLFFVLVVTFFLIFSSVSHAALVPCGRSDQGGTMCTLCDFIIGIKGLIDYGFGIMVFVALAMLVIAGIVYIVSAGNSGMMETAKGLLKNVLIGFSIILAAWLIVNTVMWAIGTKEANNPEGGGLGIQVNSWNNFTCNVKK
jgi:hypothetical protein